VYSLYSRSYVAFGKKQRILGVAAKNQQTTNIENTITGFKRFLGVRYEDPEIQAALKNPAFPFKITSVDGMAGYEANVFGEKQKMNAIQISAMLLTKLKETTETAIRAKVHDCVISVSFYKIIHHSIEYFFFSEINVVGVWL